MHQLLNSGFNLCPGSGVLVGTLLHGYTSPAWNLGSSSTSMFPRVAVSILSETSRAPARSPCAEIPVQGAAGWLCSCRVRASLVGMLWDCSTPPAASAWRQSCHFQTHGAVSSAFPEEAWPSGHSCQCLVGREMLFSLPILVAGSPRAAAPPAPLPALA